MDGRPTDRLCLACGTRKPFAEMYPRGGSPGYHPVCLACRALGCTIHGRRPKPHAGGPSYQAPLPTDSAPLGAYVNPFLETGTVLRGRNVRRDEDGGAWLEIV